MYVSVRGCVQVLEGWRDHQRSQNNISENYRWNGKHMHIYLTPGKTLDARDWNDPEDLTGDEMECGIVKILPHIDMLAADGSRVIGWLASQTDMLADDWMEV